MTRGLSDILQMFPPVQAAYGYGSGIFEQPGLYANHARSRPMLDFMLAVECPLQWHAQNMAVNRQHYSCIAALGPSAVTTVANNIGVGVYFNTMVPWQGKLVKYGVVGTAALIRDLTKWESLYYAGRLHKPVVQLRSDETLAQPLQRNLSAAVAVALLQLPASFNDRQLLTRVCEISYLADIRMAFAEDSQKVQKLVTGSWDRLTALYTPLLNTAEGIQRSGDVWLQDESPTWQSQLIVQLPQRLLTVIATRCGLSSPSIPYRHMPSSSVTCQDSSTTGSSKSDRATPQPYSVTSSATAATCSTDDASHIKHRLPLQALAQGDQRSGSRDGSSLTGATETSDMKAWERIADTAAARPDFTNLLRSSVGQIVRSSSRRQAVAGVLSAGLVKSVRYGAAKVGKALRSRTAV